MSEEKEIYACHTGLAVGDEFFCSNQSMSAEQLLPAINALAQRCDGMIKEAGIYAIRLQLVRLK